MYFLIINFITNLLSLYSSHLVSLQDGMSTPPPTPVNQASHLSLHTLSAVSGVTPVVQSLEALEPTKRRAVGTATRAYEPMGILSPITIQFKLFFQFLCSAKLDWDDQLTDEFLDQWRRLVSRLSPVKPVTVPRVPLGLTLSRSATH